VLAFQFELKETWLGSTAYEFDKIFNHELADVGEYYRDMGIRWMLNTLE
jgi:hypothetical protein